MSDFNNDGNPYDFSEFCKPNFENNALDDCVEEFDELNCEINKVLIERDQICTLPYNIQTSIDRLTLKLLMEFQRLH